MSVKNYVVLCNPSDFDTCKQIMILKDNNKKFEIVQSEFVDKSEVIIVDTSKAEKIKLPEYKAKIE